MNIAVGPPRALTSMNEMYDIAASNVVHKAGFDGVGIHATNERIDEHLPDQISVIHVQTSTEGGLFKKL